MTESSFLAFVFDILDGWAHDMTPGGVATRDERSLDITNAGFDYYIAQYGIPRTANDARHMFEWAATLTTTWAVCSEIQQKQE